MIALNWSKRTGKRLRFWLVLMAVALIVLFWIIGRTVISEKMSSPQPKTVSRTPSSYIAQPEILNPQKKASKLLKDEEDNSKQLLAPKADVLRTDGRVSLDNLPPISQKIIKTASLTIKVKHHGFNRAYDQASLIAETNGGYVASSSNVNSYKSQRSGIIVIRVPARVFNKVFRELKTLGKPRSFEIHSQDVSQEYVDLESRLRHWQAQETVLLDLMKKAQTISDSIAIQNQLSQVQQRIEEIKGRLNFLKNQTDLSTIQLTITETGIVPKPVDHWGFKTATVKAAHAFVDTINGFVIVMGYLIPLGIVCLLAYGVFSLVRRHFASATATTR
jgi:hypothetical protein